MIRVLYREDPDALDDTVWAQRVEGAKFIFQTLGECLFKQSEAL